MLGRFPTLLVVAALASVDGRESRGREQQPAGEGGPQCSAAEPYPDLYPGYSFPGSEASREAQHDCPEPFSGSATWQCGAGGQWKGAADMTRCTSLNLEDERLVLESDNRSSTAASIIAAVVIEANSSSSLAPGDIVEISSLLILAQEEALEDLENATSDEEKIFRTELMINSTASLADTVLYSTDSWVGLPAGGRNRAVGDVQESVKLASVEYSKYIHDTVREITENTLHLHISQMATAYYDAEENRTYTSQLGPHSKIMLPEKFYEGYAVSDSISVVFATYSNLDCILSQIPCDWDRLHHNALETMATKQQMNSIVLGAHIGASDTWQAGADGGRVRLTFTHLHPDDDSVDLGNKTCVFWDVSAQDWSSKGCELVESSASVTTCECSHLTNLAVIMDFNGVPKDITFFITKVISIVGFTISLITLAVTIVALLGLPEVRQRGSSVIRAHICLNLFMTEVFMVSALNAMEHHVVCSMIAAFLAYFFLTTLLWTAIEAYNLHLVLLGVECIADISSPPHIPYYVFGYGIPLVYNIVVLVGTQGRGYGTEEFCFLDSDNFVIWTFAVPLICILLINLAFVGKVIKTILAKRGLQSSSEQQSSISSHLICGTFAWFFIYSFTWLMGALFAFGAGVHFVYPYIIFASLQGLAIFLLTVENDEFIKEEIKKAFKQRKTNDGSPNDAK